MANHSLSNDLLYIDAYKQGLITVTKNGEVRNNRTGRWIGCLGSSGYLHIAITINRKVRSMYIHRLVWLVFKGPIPEGYEINHKNGIKTKNKLSNLEMITASENIKHAYKHKLKVYADANSKIPREQVLFIRQQFKDKKITIPQICKKYNVKKYSVFDMLRGISYAEIEGAIEYIRPYIPQKKLEFAVVMRRDYGVSYQSIKESLGLEVDKETVRVNVQRILKEQSNGNPRRSGIR